MDPFQNLKAFVRSSKLGSFAAASREAGTTPSVIMKRVGQLEHQLGITLFHRSTRRLDLTDNGARILPRCLQLIADFEDLRSHRLESGIMRGRLQVRSAGPAAAILFTPIFWDFMAENPRLELEAEWTGQLINPLEDDTDLAIGTSSTSYQGVLDIPLSPWPRMVCASPAYLKAFGKPRHPRELASHECLISPKSGSVWRFQGSVSEIAVNVRGRVSVNSSIALRDAALRDLGIVLLPEFIARRHVTSGALVRLFEEFEPLQLWLKALVPASKMELRAVKTFLDFLQQRLNQPWPAA